MDDFLAGPEHIFSILESALPDVRKMRQQYPDAVVLPSATALPTPSDKRWRKKVNIPTNPLAISCAAGPRGGAPAQGTRPRAPPPPADQRRHPGRAVVLAVQGRRCHRHHRRRPRRGVPPARPRQDVRAAARIAEAPGDASPASSTGCARSTARRLPMLSSKQKWETVSAGSRLHRWSLTGARPARRGGRAGGRAVRAGRPAGRSRGCARAVALRRAQRWAGSAVAAARARCCSPTGGAPG